MRFGKTMAPAAAVALGIAVLAAPALGQTVTVRFVHTNDIDRMEERDGRGGFARLAGAVAAERARPGRTIFIHTGDTLSPSLLSGIDKGRHIIDLLNRIPVDLFVPGNHDFDLGPQVFRDRLAEARFDVVSSNIREPDGRAPAHTIDDKVIDVDGIRIGFYGLTTEDTPIGSSPGEITFDGSIDTAKRKAAELRGNGADFIVAMVHTPLAVDMGLLRAGLADLVLSGHDEHLLTYFDGKGALVESQTEANFVVVTEATITKSVEQGGTDIDWWPAFRVVDTATVTPDPAIAEAVAAYGRQLDKALLVEIGVTETALDSRRASVRTQETAIGNLIADAMRAAVGADVALFNGGGIRADREYPAGAVLTRKDIQSELPFGNKTVKLEVTGAVLRRALENGVSQVREIGGRFPQVSGMAIEADLDRPVGERLRSVTIGGAPLDPGRTYTLATPDFLARGGDQYAMLAEARPIISESDAQIIAGQVIDYVAARGRVAPRVEGRVKLMP